MAILQGIGNLILDILQVLSKHLQIAIDSGRKAMEERVAEAMNSHMVAVNKMPAPSGESEEAFIGKFMADPAMQTEFPDHKQRAAVAYEKWGEKNAAKNAGAVDYQAIETAEVTIPVIRADVLSYGPGELGSSTTLGKEGAKVLYSAESLKDEEFLETVLRSPFSVSTHEKNTNEANRDVDGWACKVWFDESDQTVYAKGYVVGADNVQYVKQNKLREGFGTSAFIKFVDIKKQDGVSSTGVTYDAITTKLSCSHIAILPDIRDRKNVIVAINALQEHTDVSSTQSVNENRLSIVKNAGGTMADEKELKGMVKDAVNEAAEERAKNEKYSEMENALKAANEEIAKLKGGNAKNEEPKKDEEEPAMNAEEEDKKKEAENAKNAMASEALMSAASEILGISYAKPVPVLQVCNAFGIKGKPFHEAVIALNAKIAEHKKPTVTEEAKNSEGGSEWERLTKAL